MLALVTGGGGFLGRYIVEQLLARGDRVRSFGRKPYPELAALGVEVVHGDITARRALVSACSGVDCVFHTAALAGIGIAWEPFEQTNVVGTRHVIEACRRQRVPRLVFTSSPSVTFAGVDQCGVDERTPPDFGWLLANGAHYSRSKALAEQAVLAANGPALRTCALRPHLIWGPRDAHLVPRLIERARRGRLRRVGDGTNLVDICYVENAAAAHLAAASALAKTDASVAGHAYFLSQGEPVNCWQWIDQILALAELPPVRKSISITWATRLGAACESVYRKLRLSREPPMTRFLAAQLARSHWYDIGAARRDLKYKPAVSTCEGMRRLGKWLAGSA
jgi:nucleoside-diphosphate-sugar epimerase